MKVLIVEILDHFITVEFTDREGLQRLNVPRSAYNTSVKGRLEDIPQRALNLGIEYSDVDLVTGLGEYLSDIQARELEQAMRKAGLWTRKDYNTKPKLVGKVMAQFRHLPIDTVLVLNGANNL